ncbi:hypothetical protein [Pseudomonas sp.]|uniref:DUF7716 domain-containing protein n=1 Tax=Pseudomonas sp. TaxID=306 RepID=UPI00262694A3|nr:hypothetical protein [Pseudomonas sp.]
MKTYSIREVLQNIARMPDNWFYLPATQWTLDTRGAFSLDSKDFAPDSTDYLPPQVLSDGWVATLEKAMIEDVIFNADQQLPHPSLESYFKAFEFFYQNDAFLEFQQDLR